MFPSITNETEYDVAVRWITNDLFSPLSIENANPKFLDNIEFVYYSVINTPSNFKFASPRIKSNYDTLLKEWKQSVSSS